MGYGYGDATYHSCIVDEVVKTAFTEDRRDRFRNGPHAVDIGDIQLDDVKSPLCGVLEPVQRRCLLWGSASRDDEVVRGFEELLDDFKSDPARGSV